MRLFRTPNGSFSIKMGYAFALYSKTLMGPEKSGIMILPENGKLYIETNGGVVEVPEDSSYLRFIADSWYDDIDVHNL